MFYFILILFCIYIYTHKIIVYTCIVYVYTSSSLLDWRCICIQSKTSRGVKCGFAMGCISCIAVFMRTQFRTHSMYGSCICLTLYSGISMHKLQVSVFGQRRVRKLFDNGTHASSFHRGISLTSSRVQPSNLLPALLAPG